MAAAAATRSPPAGGGQPLLSHAAVQLLAGAGSGIVTKSSTAPLERVKILMQVEGMAARSGEPGAAARARELSELGVYGTLRKITAGEGARGLWKGNGANVVRVVPVYAIKFASNDRIRQALARPGQSVHDLSAGQMLAAGTLAGLFQQTCTYPLEVVRTRLTLAGTLGQRYRGIWHCLAQTVAREGPGALYKGIAVTWLSGGPYVGLQMTAYSLLQRHFGPAADHALHVPSKLAAGAVAGLVAQSLTFPGDTIRRRMQTNGAGGAARMYSSSWDCLVQVVRHEGALALFSGLRANAIRAIPGAAIQFVAYEHFKEALGAAAERAARR